jgi:hypothetical protein
MPPAAAGLIILSGIGVWVAGCHQYLMGKAQPGWKAIYGMVFPLGLIALALLPDVRKREAVSGTSQKQISTPSSELRRVRR